MRRSFIPLLVALALVACSPMPSPSPTPTPAPSLVPAPTVSQPVDSVTTTHHLSVRGLDLDYPADWSVNDQPTDCGAPFPP
jgi:hypothetical protein